MPENKPTSEKDAKKKQRHLVRKRKQRHRIIMWSLISALMVLIALGIGTVVGQQLTQNQQDKVAQKAAKQSAKKQDAHHIKTNQTYAGTLATGSMQVKVFLKFLPSNNYLLKVDTIQKNGTSVSSKWLQGKYAKSDVNTVNLAATESAQATYASAEDQSQNKPNAQIYKYSKKHMTSADSSWRQVALGNNFMLYVLKNHTVRLTPSSQDITPIAALPAKWAIPKSEVQSWDPNKDSQAKAFKTVLLASPAKEDNRVDVTMKITNTGKTPYLFNPHLFTLKYADGTTVDSELVSTDATLNAGQTVTLKQAWSSQDKTKLQDVQVEYTPKGKKTAILPASSTEQ